MKSLRDIVEFPNSRSAVARQLGVSPQAVQRWVKLGYAPLERALQLEQMYGVPAIYMVSPKHKKLLPVTVDSN